MKATKAVAMLSVISLGLLAACGSDAEPAAEPADAPDTSDASEPAAEPATETTEAASGPICPSTLTIQTDWFPELEHGGTYQLIGPDGTADKDTVSYSGPIQEQYKVAGLETIVINTVNFAKANSSTLLDGEADMAYIGISDIIKDSASVPLVAITKTLELDPQMIMWDPAQIDIASPSDIASTDAQVLHFQGAAYIDFMIGNGTMTAEQSNPSYDGSDAKFVADNGNFFQQGFATNEIYKYENEIQWKDGAPADVDFFTVGDLGFHNYPATITMMQDKAEELDACLTELVPKMQQAWIDFFNDPTPITDRMIEINVEHDGFWGLSTDVNNAGLALLESGGFSANSGDGTYCSMDEDRIQELYDVLAPIYTDQGTDVADSIDAMFTNKYCAAAPGR